MASKRRPLSASFGSGGSSGNLRPSSASKSGRPGSAQAQNAGKISSRSNASTDSDWSDVLAITGTSSNLKVQKKKRTPSSSRSSDSPQRRWSSAVDKVPTDLLNAEGPSVNSYFPDGASSVTKAPNKVLGETMTLKKSIPPLDLQPSPNPTPRAAVQESGEDDWWNASFEPVGSPSDFLNNKTSLWSGLQHGLDTADTGRSASSRLNNQQPNTNTHANKMPSLDDFLDNLSDEIIDLENENSRCESDKVKADTNLACKADNTRVKQDSNDLRTVAAVKIQKTFRGWNTRRKMGHIAASQVKKLLDERKAAREEQIKQDKKRPISEEEQKRKEEEERRKRREEKERLARQAAIEELQKKREDKKVENKKKAEQELLFLQANGKVGKSKSASKPKKGQKKVVQKKAEESAASEPLENGHPQSTDKVTGPPASAPSTGRKVDELFQNTREGTKTDMLDTNRSDVTSSTLKTGKSTFDDLLESIKQLEEEPLDLKVTRDSLQEDKFAGWLKDFEDDINGSDKKDAGYLSAESLERLNPRLQQGSNAALQIGNLLSEEKLKTIMSFLDEVEQADDEMSDLSQVREGAATKGLPTPSQSTSVDPEKELALLESASAAASDVTNAVMALKVELDEKKKSVDLLQRALSQQREFTLRQAKEMDKDTKQRLTLQRQEYESTIQRHLAFIDQLIDDKKTLSERCEDMVKKLKEADKKYSDKIKHLEESQSTELKKQKDVLLAAEKLRREKWINDKTQQIKEITVKGLEPDIQKLIAKHKAELKKLKSVHQAELLEADERAGRRYIQQIEELRDQLERDKESACGRERDLAQQRYEKQLEQEEQAYQQQRRRLYAEVQDEKDRIALQSQKQKHELDQAKSLLEESHRHSLLEMQNSHQKTVQEMERRHELEMNELKERLEIEKQQWIENYMKKQDSILLAKERELKEGVREARDKEIEMVISRLEQESALARDECERAAENRIKRVRDKYESELKELERSERNMQEKYTAMKGKLSEIEGECVRLRSQTRQKEQEVDDVKRLTQKLQEERSKVSDIIRQEFADRLVMLEEDNKRLKTETSEVKARHRLEIDRLNSEKEHEMDEVHKRVKQAIAKKEDTMKTLREQHQAAMKRADHLELLLQEQRKKLLS